MYDDIPTQLVIMHNYNRHSMQTFTLRLVSAFARVPSIKFLGPRDQIKQNHQNHNNHSPAQAPHNPKPTHHHSRHTLSALSEGPALKPNKDLQINLESWQIDAINSGGVIDIKYQKVKPISLLRKK